MQEALHPVSARVDAVTDLALRVVAVEPAVLIDLIGEFAVTLNEFPVISSSEDRAGFTAVARATVLADTAESVLLVTGPLL